MEREQRLRERPAPGAKPRGLVHGQRVPEPPAAVRVQQLPGRHQVDRGVAGADAAPVDRPAEPTVPDEDVPRVEIRVEPHAFALPFRRGRGPLPELARPGGLDALERFADPPVAQRERLAAAGARGRALRSDRSAAGPGRTPRARPRRGERRSASHPRATCRPTSARGNPRRAVRARAAAGSRRAAEVQAAAATCAPCPPRRVTRHGAAAARRTRPRAERSRCQCRTARRGRSGSPAHSGNCSSSRARTSDSSSSSSSSWIFAISRSRRCPGTAS